jgi:hypothetical protein
MTRLPSRLVYKYAGGQPTTHDLNGFEKIGIIPGVRCSARSTTRLLTDRWHKRVVAPRRSFAAESFDGRQLHLRQDCLLLQSDHIGVAVAARLPPSPLALAR